MVDHDAIRLALRNRLVQMDDAQGVTLPPAARRAWENEPFTPPSVSLQDPESSLWVRETLVPFDEPRRAAGYVEATGSYVLDVFYPYKAGTKLPSALVRAIKDRFEPGGPFVSEDGLEVHVDRCRSVPGDDGQTPHAWYVTQVQVEWRVYAEVGNY